MNLNQRVTTTLVIGIVAVALMLVALFALKPSEDEGDGGFDDMELEDLPDPLFEGEQDTVVSQFRIVEHATNTAVAATLGSDATSWTIDEAPEDADTGLGVDADRILQAVFSLPTATPTRVLSEIEALGTYGLDNPVYTLEFTTTAGRTHTMVIGAQNPGASAYYVQVDGSDDIYLIPSYVLDPVVGLLADPPYLQAAPEGTGTPEPTED